MGCTLTAGRSEPCKGQVGGIDRIYLINFDGETTGVTSSTATFDTGDSYIDGDALFFLTQKGRKADSPPPRGLVY